MSCCVFFSKVFNVFVCKMGIWRINFYFKGMYYSWIYINVIGFEKFYKKSVMECKWLWCKVFGDIRCNMFVKY